MDRRTMASTAIAGLLGSAAGAKVTELHQDESAVFVLHLSNEYTDPFMWSEETHAKFQKQWRERWEAGGLKPPVLLIVSPGCTLCGEGNAWMGETLGDYSYQIIAKNADEAVKMHKSMGYANEENKKARTQTMSLRQLFFHPDRVKAMNANGWSIEEQEQRFTEWVGRF